jgi:superfamily II RNA helicase
MKSRNKELKELFAQDFGIHHAGMLRSDRSMSERLFSDGLIKVYLLSDIVTRCLNSLIVKIRNAYLYI